MNKEEVLKILNIINIEYPTSNSTLSKLELKARVNLWHDMLKDIPYQDVSRVLYKYMSLDISFPPNVGKLRTMVCEPLKENVPSSTQAWEEVYKYVLKPSFTTNRKKDFNSLPEMIQKTIESPHYFDEVGGSDKKGLSYFKNKFMKDYNKVVEKEFSKLCCGEINTTEFLEQSETPLLESKTNLLD